MAPSLSASAPTIAIEGQGLEEGALLLVRRALARCQPGEALGVQGHAPGWATHLAAWCRSQGYGVERDEGADGQLTVWVTRGGDGRNASDGLRPVDAADQYGRWRGATRCGEGEDGLPAAQAHPGWGLAARGVMVEAGSPAFAFALSRRDDLWAATAGELYRQAASAQWDPQSAIEWDTSFMLADEIEAAVVQVMSYLIENENAALLVPAKHLGQIHPYYREVLQLLALQCADEARHVEVFTRRAQLRGGLGKGPDAPQALSTAGGQASLKTLFEAADFSQATFLLSVLGEGSFVNLLTFLHAHAPDPVTRQIARLTARDEARHVAFGMAHLEFRLAREPDYQSRLRNAIESRFDTLAQTAGLNEEVFDALVLLAAGDLSLTAVSRGHQAVQQLKREMASGRKARLLRLGFDAQEAERLAQMHTRNFM